MSVVGNEIKRLGLQKAYQYLDRDPETNLPKLMDWFDMYTQEGVLKIQRDLFRRIVAEKDSNWYQLLVSLWDDIDDDVRKTLFENLVINANALAAPKAAESRQKFGCNIPWAINMDIEDSNRPEALDFDEWDSIIEQAKELGTFMFIFEGGEPLDSVEEIIALCNKHDECEFMVFTNGRMLTEEIAGEMLRVKNIIPVIRVNGTPDDMELVTTAEILRQKKLPYCSYSFYNRENMHLFSREDFFDTLVRFGTKMSFFFSSVPDDEDTVYPLMKEYRHSKPLVTIHFCKDKDVTGGCVAGGKYFCSIDSAGNLEPCFFIRMSDSNLRRKSLVEALQSPVCMLYHDADVLCRAEK